MEQTWLGKAEARGIRKGRAEGRAQGRAQEKARAVEQMRRMVLQGIEQRFGAVPERVAARVRVLQTLEPLGRMLQKLATAKSADDLLSRRRHLSES